MIADGSKREDPKSTPLSRSKVSMYDYKLQKVLRDREEKSDIIDSLNMIEIKGISKSLFPVTIDR
jgi:hypothetical protein